jgi:hypothetical protein
MSQLSRKYGINISHPYRPSQPITGLVLIFLFMLYVWKNKVSCSLVAMFVLCRFLYSYVGTNLKYSLTVPHRSCLTILGFVYPSLRMKLFKLTLMNISRCDCLQPSLVVYDCILQAHHYRELHAAYSQAVLIEDRVRVELRSRLNVNGV